MYELVALAHPVFARIKPLGARDLREELPTRAVLVSVGPGTPPTTVAAIRDEVSRAMPGRRVLLSVRAIEPAHERQPARCKASPPAIREVRVA